MCEICRLLRQSIGGTQQVPRTNKYQMPALRQFTFRKERSIPELVIPFDTYFGVPQQPQTGTKLAPTCLLHSDTKSLQK